jgi:hypothetical protein
MDQSTPFVYRLGEGSDVFLTAVRDCSAGSEDKIGALTRQLFVGLEKVEVHRRHALSVDGTPFDEAEVSANVGSDDLSFVAYTGKTGSGCVVDLLFWNENSKKLANDPPARVLSAEEVRPKAETVLPSLLR